MNHYLMKILILAGPAFRSRSPCPGLRGPDAKNQGYHRPIEIKLSMSHYSHKSMPDAKFESGGFSIFGDMTSQNFPLKKGTSHRIRIFTPRTNVFHFKNEFSCPESFFSTQN